MGGEVKIRRRYYGWHDGSAFRLSLYPADAPVRPSLRIEDASDLKALLSRKRAEVAWWPPLPDHINAEIEKGLRLD